MSKTGLSLRLLAIVAVVLTATSAWWGSSAAEDRAANAAEERQKTTSTQAATDKEAKPDAEEQEEKYVPKTKRQLRRELSSIQYDVTQNEATEPAFRNRYWNNKQKGTYHCIVCDRPLFSSNTKYKSGTGWPSFWAPIKNDHVGYRKDYRLFYSRIEVHCSRCNAHLGHVFDDGPKPTGKRYCMNSASLKFVEADDKDEK